MCTKRSTRALSQCWPMVLSITVFTSFMAELALSTPALVTEISIGRGKIPIDVEVHDP